MLLFCPQCSNMLRVGKVPPGDPTIDLYVGQNRFECITCPYQFVITKRYYERKYLKKKETEDIIGGEGAWDNVDQTDVQCPNDKCRNDKAYWYQLQIRSADEPMTAFYKCTKCEKEWRE
ncbi:DNA-directed RNA polymeras-like protein III subunit RPC10 [Lophiostoma macrostomum CBS 122681]|uniref:DNA-directed RNA polymerase subunit n=1 Tax=Lophiostoma macrostomum CBS 122681 TaxID=1314788 RepID=A0A6A6TA80_9PLEO|nr:DNA-directed RNA polymeras-like protein III subunit RPC10 [Lophiostoma macrostomum CBS 122681]